MIDTEVMIWISLLYLAIPIQGLIWLGMRRERQERERWMRSLREQVTVLRAGRGGPGRIF